MNMPRTWSGPALETFAAAGAAIGQIPPAFPLEATAAVNPWLGQTGESRLAAAARLRRVGGGRVFLPRAEAAAMLDSGLLTDADLAAGAAAHGLSPEDLRRAARTEPAPAAPLPSIADLAAADSGIDWPGLIEDRIGLWAAAHFDRGQAFWPAPEQTAWPSWRAFASRDLTPGIAGLPGFAARLADAPAASRPALAAYCETLDLSAEAAPAYFHRLLVTLSGWAQYARHLGFIAERDGTEDTTAFDLLTVRLSWEVALLEAGGAARRAAWAQAQAAFAEPAAPDADLILDAALQQAVDAAAERQLAGTLSEPAAEAGAGAPPLQAAFCIDTRSEVLRRAIEAADGGVQTIGFAGFFGLPVRHHGFASDIEEARAPVLLTPSVDTRSGGDATEDTAARIRLRTVRAWGRFKRAAVSGFAYVEAAGPLYVWKLLRDSFTHGAGPKAEAAPQLDLPLDARIATAGAILGAMSLTEGFARLVLVCGHGATVTNAPHASALQCGACGGHAGDVNARLLAGLLNEAPVREGLRAKGIPIPAETVFVAGLHDTVSDEVRLFADGLPASHAEDLARLRRALAAAGPVARTERAATLPRGTAEGLAARGRTWSEVRPEWGLAGCRAFIAAPRNRTRGRNLGGRVFLHDYSWRRDDEDAGTLEQILAAPVVVASWIALQYHGSSVAPEAFGAGNKLLHNVVGGIGVLEGNGGGLRTGLPWQSVHDGSALRHLPARLIVAVDAPEPMIAKVLARRPDVAALFDNGWLTLCALDKAGGLGRRWDRGRWRARDAAASPLPDAA
ncbi:YbcC family protein [Oceaniglobus roseus]|uniref:YbcC family protein n=1 Tax=Oceaniglobus roseus TaxID=1737570 RepID=UPI000C7F3501|nr:DUF2309 domain-containing protein [Kandeliimicrobium roseum]